MLCDAKPEQVLFALALTTRIYSFMETYYLLSHAKETQQWKRPRLHSIVKNPCFCRAAMSLSFKLLWIQYGLEIVGIFFRSWSDYVDVSISSQAPHRLLSLLGSHVLGHVPESLGLPSSPSPLYYYHRYY